MARAALRTRSRGAIPGAVPPQLADAQIQVRETRFGRFEMTWQDGDMRFKMRRPGSSYLQSAPMICLVADSELWNGGPMSLEAQVRLSYDPGPHRGEAGTGPRPAEWQGADR